MHIPNTEIDPISLREYGRNMQNLIRRIKHVSDKEARNTYTKALVPLMRIINPHFHHNTNSSEKIWHDIFFVADYSLDVTAPYPIPHQPSLQAKPASVPYMDKPLKYKRYGRHMLTALEQVKHLTDQAQVEQLLLQIAKWILTFHRKHSGIEDILRYFRDVVGKSALPDLTLIRQKLQESTPSHKHGKHQPKRYFRKKRKS